MNQTVSATTPTDIFIAELVFSLKSGTFARLIISSPPSTEPKLGNPNRIQGRLIEVQKQPTLSLTYRYPTRDETKNFAFGQVSDLIRDFFQAGFQNALLCTTSGDWQLNLAPGKKPRLIRHPASIKIPPSKTHDRTKLNTLGQSAQDWLCELGIADPQGRIRPSMMDKDRQIRRYLEIVDHLVENSESDVDLFSRNTPIHIVDVGCGKGYLTFGIWHLFARVLQRPVKVTGIELRPGLVTECNRIAQAIGANGLEFVAGSIGSTQLPPTDVLVALHACNTATDDAIRQGISLKAKLILVAPCCHQQLRPRIIDPAVLSPVLSFGIMKERFSEWITDGLRALYLQYAGYTTNICEFVPSEHTPKNVMISAVLKGSGCKDPQVIRQIEEIKTFIGISDHPLDSLLPMQDNSKTSTPANIP